MQRQYNKLKAKHKDAILLYRLGDFYEAFNEDAKILAKDLSITLTGRGKGPSRIPMAGIPHHALDNYLPKLILAGRKVAIAEQLEEPKPGKLVERDVTKIITAGTITDEKSLVASENNYLVSIYPLKGKSHNIIGVSYIDLTTGEFKVFETIVEKLTQLPAGIVNEIKKNVPNEILILDKYKERFSDYFKGAVITSFDDEYLGLSASKKVLNGQFETRNLKGFGIGEYTAGIIAAAEIIEYLNETQKTELGHIKKIKIQDISEFMELDQSTIRNLELFYPLLPGRKGSTVYEVLNHCQTSMGQRLIRSWILQPLKNREKIYERSDVVEYFFNNKKLLNKITDGLDNVYDIERILGRIGLSSANARDLKALELSLENITKIGNTEFNSPPKKLKQIVKILTGMSEISYIIDLIKNSIVENPSNTITEGGLINDGYDESLDELRKIANGGKDEIIKVQQAEIKSTGIQSLKIKYNRVFGYYIEISKSNLSKAPEHYVRKQTLANAERYITPELKELEDKVLGAEERILELEYELFSKIRNDIAQYIPSLQELSKAVATLDVLSTFSCLAINNNYVKSEFNKKREFDVKESRHIVIERLSEEEFISNDLSLSKSKNLMILTGPNMSGKSTYIRQIALVSLIAQIGSFVPAKKANLPVLDRIFTRVGASDNLVEGESTFMVEMNETANILNNATENSLIILDEVGRGTSTYDGIAIAWSITEYIHEKLGSFTLFATHYHEMTQLEEKLERAVNYNVVVKEDEGQVTFMRKIEKGGTDKSYGIYVAKLAGMPKRVVSRANKILENLEENVSDVSKGKNPKKAEVQLMFMPVGEGRTEKGDGGVESRELIQLKEIINEIDVNNMTPMEAIKKLEELRQLAEGH